jgi:hypothetical protein
MEEDAIIDDDYFSDDELPPHETNEVTDEWLFSHLMDATSTIASDKSSWGSGKNAITDDVEANAEADPEDNELKFAILAFTFVACLAKPILKTMKMWSKKLIVTLWLTIMLGK